MFQTKIAISANTVQSTQMEDQSARMFAVEEICAEEIQSVPRETTMLSANANKAFTRTERFVARSNVILMMSVATTRSVTITCARLFA